MENTREIKGIVSRATAKTLGEWVQLYEEKTGETAILPDGFLLYYLPDRGFAEYKVDTEGKMLLIYQVCGDARFWRDMGEIICKDKKLNYISTICSRNIKAYIRFYNWTIEKELEVEKGHERFYCRDSLGRDIVITIRSIDKEGKQKTYWVTQHIY